MVKRRNLIIFALIAASFVLTYANAKSIPKAPFELDPSEPIKLAADRVSFDNKAMTVRWEGNVVAMQRDVKMSAALVVIQFEKKANAQSDGQIPMFSGSGDISSITATGGVKMMQAERRAVCEKVVFDQKADIIIFSGSPRIFAGSDSLAGDKIIVHIKDQRVEVAGSPGRRVVATVMPKGEDGFLPTEARERMEELEKNPPPTPEPPSTELKPDNTSAKSKDSSLMLDEPTP